MTTRARLTPAEIASITADHAAGVPIATICATHNVANSTIYHYVGTRNDVELTGGEWRIDTRRRIQVWVPDVVMDSRSDGTTPASQFPGRTADGRFVPSAECGTDGGYYRHRRSEKSEACDACKRAHADAELARQRKRVA